MKSTNLSIQYDSNISLIYKVLYILMFAFALFFPHSITAINVFVGKINIYFNIFAILYILLLFLSEKRFMASWVLIPIMMLSLFCSQETADIRQLLQPVGSFLCLTFFIEAQQYIEIDKGFVKFISYFNIAIFLIFLLYSQMDFAYRYLQEGNYYVYNALTLGYSNSNSTAMMLLFVAAVNIISIKMKTYNKLIGIVMQLTLIYLIYKTESRTGLLCVVILSILSLITVSRVPRFFLYVFTSIPFIYIFLLPYLQRNKYFMHIEILGKRFFTGREEIFSDNIEGINSIIRWIFGDLPRAMFANYHNGMLSILLSCGLAGLIIYLIIWYKNIIPYMERTNQVSYIAIISLMIILLQSSSEAAFLTGGIPYGIMIVTLFIFVRYEDEDNDNENTSY